MNSQTHGLISYTLIWRCLGSIHNEFVNVRAACRGQGLRETGNQGWHVFTVKTELLPTNASVIQSSQPVSASTNAPAPSWQSTSKAHKQVDEEYHNHY